MSNTPFMQFYVGDYLADTLDLTTEQHGAYLLLLMTMWNSNAKLPSDKVKLARIARLTPAKFKAVWSEISRFFEDDGESISNRRLTKEREKANEKSAKRSTAGRAGGHAKALKDNEAHLANAMRMPQHLSEPEPDITISDEIAIQPPVPADAISEAVHAYNDAADRSGWTRMAKLTPARRSALRGRLKDVGGVEGWKAAIARAEASDFICGRVVGSRGPFKCSFDFLCQQSSFTRLMEGQYDNRPQQPSFASPRGQQSGAGQQFTGIAGAVMRRRAERAQGLQG